MDDDKKLLMAIAKSVLTQLLGEGAWYTQQTRPCFKKIENPVMGLEVGDVVFTYNDLEQEMQERQVVAIVDGIGYVLTVSNHYGPELMPVSDDWFGKTVKDSAKIHREQIELDIEYAQRLHKQNKKLKALLGQ